MDKRRWSQMWFGFACVVAVGYGVLMHNLATDGQVSKSREWEYQQKIGILQAQLEAATEKDSTVFIDRMQSPTQKGTVAPILKRLKPRMKESVLFTIDEAVMKYSDEYDLPPELVVYLMKRESNFNTRAFSSVGAVGLMQVFPKWHRDKMVQLGIQHEEVYNIDHNVRLGCWILRNYLDQTGSIDKALTKYVGGKHEKYVKDILVGYTNEMIYMKGK